MSIIKIKISEIREIKRLRSTTKDSPELFKSLCESVKELGVLIPIRAIEHFNDYNNTSYYTVVDGFRRVEACKQLQIPEIMAIIDVQHSPRQIKKGG